MGKILLREKNNRNFPFILKYSISKRTKRMGHSNWFVKKNDKNVQLRKSNIGLPDVHNDFWMCEYICVSCTRRKKNKNKHPKQVQEVSFALWMKTKGILQLIVWKNSAPNKVIRWIQKLYRKTESVRIKSKAIITNTFKLYTQ